MMSHYHYALFKPCGYLSQFINNSNKRKQKKLLGELYNFAPNTMAIGRLDEKSEGLLLLTTDGQTSNFITSKKVSKEYYVQVDGLINEETISKLQKGVTISINGTSYQTLPCTAFILEKAPNFPPGVKVRDERHGPTSWISITLNEGKFRQVRKMTAVCGFPTLRLVRVRIGNIKLLDLQPGQVKPIPDIKSII